jgi:linoleoyl-CoA desaturase
MWVLYGFLPLKWQFMDDFICMAWGRIAQNRFPRPRGWQLWSFFLGKAIFLSWTLVLPLLFHPLWIVLCYYFVTSHIVGLTLSVIFQLAHATEQADFPSISDADPRCDNEWAVHQVQSTVDFARGNPILNWYLGGLNYQIEHHLFPQVSHIHYPALAGIVEATCAEFGVRYFAHKTLFCALASHQRWLRRMGRPA